MSTKTFDVTPVTVGLDSTIEIEYTQEIIDTLSLQQGSIKADVREKKLVSSALIARKSTGAGISWDQNILKMELTSTETALIQTENVYFDFIHELNGSKRKVPGDWEWPVEKTVTDPDA